MCSNKTIKFVIDIRNQLRSSTVAELLGIVVKSLIICSTVGSYIELW